VTPVRGATPGGRVTPRRSFDSPLAHPPTVNKCRCNFIDYRFTRSATAAPHAAAAGGRTSVVQIAHLCCNKLSGIASGAVGRYCALKRRAQAAATTLRNGVDSSVNQPTPVDYPARVAIVRMTLAFGGLMTVATPTYADAENANEPRQRRYCRSTVTATRSRGDDQQSSGTQRTTQESMM